MPTTQHSVNGERVFSVAQLTMSIKKNLLANNEKLASVWIEGEVSGMRIYQTGHRYFSLKDKDAVINCVLFAFCVNGCDDAFKSVLAKGDAEANGLKVLVQGELDLNMSRGQYSFKVKRLKLKKDDIGERMAQFNALKAKLEAEGLNKLDHPERRRALPFLPRRIAIVTSPAGAVIHDMCDTINRRFPNVEIRLYPAKVQGQGAAESLVAGIRFFNGELVGSDPAWRPDVLIVARGGGSMEDLWAFNEEVLVRAVAASGVPVVSAVGHESDVTLCDYAADLRAGTPSIAAERVVPMKAELAARVADLASRLGRSPMGFVENQMQRVDDLAHRLEIAPGGAIARWERRAAELAARLAPAVKEALAGTEKRVQRAALSLEPPLRRRVQGAEAALEKCARSLELLNPYSVLERGYSITTGEDGSVVRDAAEVRSGERLVTRLASGTVESVAV
ncbi:MAG: exodeoxyribonuclease VII large subunit [Kiritimatiellae bacterium]|nr:exodeoxyribonuclease VII large subunit [Kiritimatiellia bacterium]